MISIIFLLGWFGAVGFSTWVAYSNGHPVWACIIAILGIGCVQITKSGGIK